MTTAQLQAIAAHIYASGETASATIEKIKNNCWHRIYPFNVAAEDSEKDHGDYIYDQGVTEAAQMERIENYVYALVNA